MAFLTPDGELSDEDIQQLIELGVIPDKQDSLDKQMSIAEKLRYGAGPEMRGNNRVQTAANPLEFIAHGIEAYKAGKQLDAIRQQQNDLLKQQTEGRTKYFKGLRGPRGIVNPRSVDSTIPDY